MCRTRRDETIECYDDGRATRQRGLTNQACLTYTYSCLSYRCLALSEFRGAGL